MNVFFNSKRLPLAVALVLSLISTEAFGQTRLPDCYVLSAGVDNYLHANKLQGDVNDARNTAAAFQSQQGKLFGRVHATTLLDGQATRGNILGRLQGLAKTGQAGDTMVIFFSGHGGVFNDSRTWYLLPYDYHPQNAGGSVITDRQLLDASDVLVRQGKKVYIIIDACFSGQLRNTAQAYFNKYRDANGGGLVIMASSSAQQTSNALGQYSAFAKAFADGMAGGSDLNRDGRITLDELRQYTFKRTYDLLKQHNNSGKQDSIVAWSPSMVGNTSVAVLRPTTTLTPTPGGINAARRFNGSENLAGYGRLSFTLNPNGHAVMVDARGAWEGSWHQSGNRITLRFDNGRVVYSGTLSNGVLSGNAGNGRTNWSFSVRGQSATVPAVALRN